MKPCGHWKGFLFVELFGSSTGDLGSEIAVWNGPSGDLGLVQRYIRLALTSGWARACFCSKTACSSFCFLDSLSYCVDRPRPFWTHFHIHSPTIWKSLCFLPFFSFWNFQLCFPFSASALLHLLGTALSLVIQNCDLMFCSSLSWLSCSILFNHCRYDRVTHLVDYFDYLVSQASSCSLLTHLRHQ